MHIGFHSEIFWCNDCTNILVVGQMALFPFASSFAYKFCHFPPLCVADCPRRIYYVVHRLPSIIKVTIHLRVHKHLMVDGKCRESMNKIRRLIAKEVDRTPNAKISTILMGVNKTFFTTHLFDDSGNGTLELLNGEQLE